jgi:pyridoxine/pyridoxamine 5'-phosphate oxidase
MERLLTLLYDTKAMILEIGSPSRRTTMMGDENSNDLCFHLNLLEERREIAAIREAAYKKEMEKYYNARVRGKRFKIGDWVLRNNEAGRQESQ